MEMSPSYLGEQQAGKEGGKSRSTRQWKDWLSKPVFFADCTLHCCFSACAVYSSLQAHCSQLWFLLSPQEPFSSRVCWKWCSPTLTFLPRLNSSDRNAIYMLRLPASCCDAQLWAADKFLTLKASPEMDWTARPQKGEGLSGAPQSTSLTMRYRAHPSYHIHLEISVRGRYFPLTSTCETFPSHFQSAFSKLDVHTLLLWVFRRLQRPRWELKNRKELRKILSVVGKGNFPRALCHTMRRDIRFPATRIGEGLLAQPAQLPAGCTPTAVAQKWCPKQPKQSHSILPKLIQRAVYPYLYNKHGKLFPPTSLTLCMKDFEVSFQHCLFWFNLWHVLALAVNPVFHDKLPSKVLGCAWLRMNVVFLRGWPACCFLYFPVSILPSFRGFLCDLPAFHWFHYHKNLLCHQ